MTPQQIGIICVIIVIIVIIIILVIFYRKSAQTNSNMVTYSKLGSNGRLGNQLFQIAATLGVANKERVFASLPEWSYEKYFVNNLPRSTVSNKSLTIPENDYIDYEEITHPKDGTTIDIDGHRQSEHYFSHCRDSILKQFKFKPELLAEVTAKFQELNPNNYLLLGIHIRMGDYKTNSDFIICSNNYYYQALDHLKKQNSQRIIILFSDEPQLAAKVLNDYNENYIISPFKDEIHDLLAFSLCRYKILSNSTFSWWADYLGRELDAYTIAPYPWLHSKSNPNKYHDKGSIYRPTWQLLDSNSGEVVNSNRTARENYVKEQLQNSLKFPVKIDSNLNVPMFIISMNDARLDNTYNELSLAGFDQVNHFKAINGKNADYDKLVEYGLIAKDFHILAPKEVNKLGEIGCTLGHGLIWSWLLSSPYDYAIVFEDDAEVDKRIKDRDEIAQYIKDCLRTMPDDWSILYLGSCADNCQGYQPQNIKYLVKTKRSYCSHAYCISKFGAKHILNNMPFIEGSDAEMQNANVRDNLDCYATYPSYFWQAIGKFPSDLRPDSLARGNIIQCQ